MVKKNRTGPTADRYIEATLELISERGGSTQVNLREISRQIGCAHTNAYNYFDNREDLLWHALRRALQQYANSMTDGLDESESLYEFFNRFIRNIVEWPIQNPGLHRFISSDPMEPDQIPKDIIENVVLLKTWIEQVLKALTDNQIDTKNLDSLVNIMLGYLDGEIFNLINGRVLPGEDIANRVVKNLECLFTLLTAKNNDGIVLSEQPSKIKISNLPKLSVKFY